jgi:citrate lyase subunit gamma (acyl carrier protein)
MTRVIQRGQAGLAEKSDVLITIEPRQTGEGRLILVKSPVMLEFGRQITETVHAVLDAQNICDATVQVEDKGALEFVLRARCDTALRRALKECDNNEP